MGWFGGLARARTHTQCTCTAHVIHIQCTRNAHTMHTRCTRNAHAMHTQCTRNTHAMHTQCTRNAHAMHTQCTYIYARVHTIIIANANAAGPLGAHHNPPNLSRFRFHISARSLSGERLPRTPSTSPVGRRYALLLALFCSVIVFV